MSKPQRRRNANRGSDRALSLRHARGPRDDDDDDDDEGALEEALPLDSEIGDTCECVTVYINI